MSNPDIDAPEKLRSFHYDDLGNVYLGIVLNPQRSYRQTSPYPEPSKLISPFRYLSFTPQHLPESRSSAIFPMECSILCNASGLLPRPSSTLLDAILQNDSPLGHALQFAMHGRSSSIRTLVASLRLPVRMNTPLQRCKASLSHFVSFRAILLTALCLASAAFFLSGGWGGVPA